MLAILEQFADFHGTQCQHIAWKMKMSDLDNMGPIESSVYTE